MRIKKYLFIVILLFVIIFILKAENIYTGSLSGNAYNVSLGGNSIGYPWSISQTNLINPAFSAYQSQNNSFSFFNFSYFSKIKNRDKRSYSWILTFKELISYGYIQNRYKNIKDKKLSFNFNTGKHLFHGLAVKWREKQNDIDLGLDLGGLLVFSDNIAFGWHVENIYPPTINNVEEPWIINLGAGFKPYKILGLSFSVKTSETFDIKYSGGVEIKHSEKYSFRTGITENGYLVLGNSLKVYYGYINITYKYDNNNKSVFYITFSTNFDKTLED